jgi:hypothetical protein
MKTNPCSALAVVAAISSFLCSIHNGQCFYNPSAGCWLTRDPVKERGGQNVYAFLRNSCPNGIDAFGLECWLVTYHFSFPDMSVAGHSVLHCDNPETYISFSQDRGITQWDTEKMDDAYFGQEPSEYRIRSALDEQRISDWLQNAKNGIGFINHWTLANNCADAVDAAIAAGLTVPQKKPCRCPRSTDRGFRWVVLDLLDRDPKFTRITMPSGTEERVQLLDERGGQRYTCALLNERTGQYTFPRYNQDGDQ